MSTENSLTLFDNDTLPDSLDDLLDQIDTAVAEAPAPVSDNPFLKFESKGAGVWTFGQGGDTLAETDRVVLITSALERGYFAWFNGAAERRMAHISQPKPAEPPPLGMNTSGPNKGKESEWIDTFAGPMKILSGEHEGATVWFDGASKGGQSMILRLVAEVRKQKGHPGKYIFPVMTLGKSDKQDDYGNWYPRYKILDWINAKGESRLTAGEAKVVSVETVETEDTPPKGKRRKIE